MEGQEQQLFLMEFLVDKVNIPSVRAMHDDMLPVETCVSFQVLNLPPINICQEASSDGCTCVGGDVQYFKKGKSCLFALPSIVVEKPLPTFPVTMSVYKKLPPGVLPDVMLIGTHQIQAKDLFNALLSHHVFEAGNPSRTMRETFKITTATGQNVGEVTVFVRVSCFGKKIVTQFQIPHNKKPYLFKGAANSPVYQCKKLPSGMIVPHNPGPKCCCAREAQANSRGSGEAYPRTCCPTPQTQPAPRSPANYKPPDYGPRPCCPSQRCPPEPCPPATSFTPQNSFGSSYGQSTRKCGCPAKEGKGCN
ncbi:uncharacterized protein LOC107222283 [Neodiprion lecontei]|uniref:Uncharacterized protein LOC107222283 n=1 Tax=Neodiprion lecontei TaxID=441921 RepID=A0A6J0BRD0_NEOLC|nr:uncharacterized protein LOC107222283 [Neodiprion lecontei]